MTPHVAALRDPSVGTQQLHQTTSAVAQALLDYCQRNNWAGYDPYDAINSRFLARTPLCTTRYGRIALTQALKRLPINLRPLLGIRKEQNAKAMALFLGALLKRASTRKVAEDGLIAQIVERLEVLRAPDSSYWCWGYSFPWQTRTVLVPRSAPNLVCTTFVADALLDLYEAKGDVCHLDMALSAATYIVRELYWAEDDAAGFSYPVPGHRTRVHNGNLLGAALLCRVSKHCGGVPEMLDAALAAARYAAARQREDGSWPYGEQATQGWVDNFHTGYNLCALQTISCRTGTSEFLDPLGRGFRFYRANFFTPAGAPKYFHNRTSPIDIHCVAQSIITLVSLRDLDEHNLALAQKVLAWALDHMWDARAGCFHYRYGILGPVRISYMRWAQAWMLLALETLEQATDGADAETSARASSVEAVCFSPGDRHRKA